MKENRRPIIDVEYAVNTPHKNIACVYESSHKYLKDERFHAFPVAYDLYSDWKNAWERAEELLNAKDPDLYYGVQVKDLTLVFGASTDKQELENLGFDVEDDWNGFLRHHADKLLRLKMQELGVMDKLADD